MKLLIDEDEWYPVYELEPLVGSVFGVVAEITPEFKQKHDRIMGEFRELQRELSDMFDNPTSS